MRHWSFHIPFLVVSLCAISVRDAAPQGSTAYLQLSPTVKAVLYTPDASVKARVAVVNMHEDGNRLSDIACTELVKRGFYVLCMNGRSDNINHSFEFGISPFVWACVARYSLKSCLILTRSPAAESLKHIAKRPLCEVPASSSS